MTELITTAEEFAALPIGTVVRSPGGYVFEQWRSGWERVGIALDWWHDEMAKNYSPATVLYRPDAEPTVPPKLRVKFDGGRRAVLDGAVTPQSTPLASSERTPS